MQVGYQSGFDTIAESPEKNFREMPCSGGLIRKTQLNELILARPFSNKVGTRKKKFLLDGSQTTNNKLLLKKELRRIESFNDHPDTKSFSSSNLKNCYTNNSTLDKKQKSPHGGRRNEKLGQSSGLPLSKTLDLFDSTNHHTMK